MLVPTTVAAATAPMGEDDRADVTNATDDGADLGVVTEVDSHIIGNCHRGDY